MATKNEQQTCKELIEPALTRAGWDWEREILIGPGRVNLTGDKMYEASQELRVDYVLRLARMPLAVLEAKAEFVPAAEGMQQASRYAQRLGLRFSIASNGRDYVITDNQSGQFETLKAPPSPEDIFRRLGLEVDLAKWRPGFEYPWHVDQITRKAVRPYQEIAIFQALAHFASGDSRVLMVMATGTGKTFTVFQLVWKLIHGGVLKRNHVLFLTDRNSLQDQAYKAFSAFPADERMRIDKEVVRRGEHLVASVFFANYQSLDEDLDGKKVYEHFDPDFFDLVIVDECHRSGFGDWFGVLNHFGSAYQLGLTATPRAIEEIQRQLTEEERRRDTFDYFGDPVYTYSLRQAIEDGYLVPYLLEERVTNLDENGFVGPDGKRYETQNFERDIVLPDRTRLIAEDIWEQLNRYGFRDEKSIIFCVDDTHAAFMAAELRRLSGDPDYAARITRSERNSHQLERNFAEVGRAKPRVAVTVDLLSTGFDAPDVRNIVFARPLRSAILYKQMKGRGTRLCEDIDKRYFTIFDYTGASSLEDTEFDGHPANRQKPLRLAEPRKRYETEREKPVEQGIAVFISASQRYVCFADGRKIPFEDYRDQSKDFIRSVAPASLADLLKLWIDKTARKELREGLKDNDIYISAFRHFFDLDGTDDVDILGKVGFDLVRVPTRHERVVRFWDKEQEWLLQLTGEKQFADEKRLRERFWQTSLDHYGLHGIDDLEQGATYRAPHFVEQFGSFASLLKQYGGADRLKSDLEMVKNHLYVPMTV
jgi:type I restriction enzyme R subunit